MSEPELRPPGDTVLNSIAPIREKRPNGLCFAALQVHSVQNRIFSYSLRSEQYIAYAIYCSERYEAAPRSPSSSPRAAGPLAPVNLAPSTLLPLTLALLAAAGHSAPASAALRAGASLDSLLAYPLAFALAWPVLGTLGRSRGWGPVLGWGAGLFMVGTGLSAWLGTGGAADGPPTDLWAWTAARALAGVGGAALTAAALEALTHPGANLLRRDSPLAGDRSLGEGGAGDRGTARHPGNARAPWLLGALGGAILAGGLLGNVGGGNLGNGLGSSAWSWVSVVMAAGTLGWAASGLATKGAASSSWLRGGRRDAKAVDLLGTALLATLCLAVWLALGGWLWAWVLAGAALVGLVASQRQVTRPAFLPVSLLRQRPFALTVALAFFAGALTLGSAVFGPLYSGLGLAGGGVGLGLLLLLGLLPGLALGPWMTARGQARPALLAGAGAAALGLVLAGFLGLQTSGAASLGALLLGLGLGPLLSVPFALLPRLSGARERAAAQDTTLLAHLLGGAAGLALGSALLLSGPARAGADVGWPALLRGETVQATRPAEPPVTGSNTPTTSLDQALLRRALYGSAQAAATLRAQGELPPEVSGWLEDGGLAAQVRRRLGAQARHVELVVAGGNRAYVDSLGRRLPDPEIGARLQRLSDRTLADPKRRATVGAALRARLEARIPAQVNAAVREAIGRGVQVVPAASAPTTANPAQSLPPSATWNGPFWKGVFWSGLAAALLALGAAALLPAFPSLPKGSGLRERTRASLKDRDKAGTRRAGSALAEGERGE